MKIKWTNRCVWAVSSLFVFLIVASTRSLLPAEAQDLGKLESGPALSAASSPDTCPVDMIAYWKLDETGGSPFEDYFASNDGACTVDQCPDPSEGFLNGGQFFDSDEIYVPSAEAFNWPVDSSFSIELWVKPEVLKEDRVEVFISRHTATVAWWVGYDKLSGKAIFSLRDSTGDVHVEIWGNTALHDGDWHQVVAVQDGAQHEVRLYVDGKLDVSMPVIFGGDWGTNTRIGIGFHNDIGIKGPQSHFHGQLDEIAIYGKALSPAEIQYQHEVVGLDQDYCEPVDLVVNVEGFGSVDVLPLEPYKLGQEVTLTAKPDPGFIFYSWSGDITGYDNPVSIIMDSDKLVTVKFSEPVYHTLTVGTIGQGTVVLDPDQGVYLHREVVKLLAVPEFGWVFQEWRDDVTGIDNPAALAMNGDKAVTALFIRLNPTDLKSQIYLPFNMK